jgi:cell division septal protein FtsQ
MNLDREASAIADAAAEEVRTLNHRTFDAEAFKEPADVYRTVNNLTLLVHGLPQANEKTWKRLRMMEQDETIRMDNGTDVQEGMEEARQQLGRARQLLAESGGALDRATQTLSHMGGR